MLKSINYNYYDSWSGSKHRKQHNTWHKEWKKRLSPEEKSLIEFMEKDRNKEVHTRGSGRNTKTGKRPTSPMNFERSTGAFAHFTAPHGVSLGHSDIQTYEYTIAKIEQPATDACTKYAALRAQMVAQFEADHP